ncbi:MAG: hypothetical protein LBJ87_14500 [bacterium]|nr:hypothetical protein [bacterium]
MDAPRSEQTPEADGIAHRASSALTGAAARVRRPGTVQPVRRVLVAGVFPDRVQAEEAARALEAWRRANRSMGLGPAAVLEKRVSNTIAYQPQHVRAGRATVRGLFVGLILFALPAAGAAALAAFALGSVVFGLLGLIGAVSGDQASFLEILVTLVAVFLVALVVGALGAGIGSLVGLCVGLINDRARGFADLQRTDVARGLEPGSSAVLLWSSPLNAPTLEGELRRLGGEPRTLAPGRPEAEAFARASSEVAAIEDVPAPGTKPQEEPVGGPAEATPASAEASSDE